MIRITPTTAKAVKKVLEENGLEQTDIKNIDTPFSRDQALVGYVPENDTFVLYPHICQINYYSGILADEVHHTIPLGFVSETIRTDPKEEIEYLIENYL